LVLALNDGPFDAPPPPPPVSQPSESENTKELKEALGKLTDAVNRLAEKPVAAAPVVAAPSVVVADPCNGLPDLTVYFDFDKFVVKPNYQSQIEAFGPWLGNHPSCRLQVEGHTCTIGSAAYNANLGRNRAWAVYSVLLHSVGKEVMQQQILQPVSVTYDKPASEHKPENRRVILRVIGPATGK
jgi:peptidoglycan-associated lipoprotein